MARKFLIDTDPGVDDAQAILMACAHPDVELLGLTVVSGNVGLDHTLTNACHLVDLMSVPVPVFPGCTRPLGPIGEDAAFVHGSDGFGDLELPPPRAKAATEHAAQALVRLINAHPGEITLVAIGPLTNVAVALLLDPGLPDKLDRLVVMGGAVTGQGNVSNISAEFNIYSDPEAASLVFAAFDAIDLVDWEATMAHSYSFEVLDGWLSCGSPHARLFDRISQVIRRFVLAEHGEPIMRAADALAMAVALEPESIQASSRCAVDIELTGALTRGQTVVDWQGRTSNRPQCRIVTAFDMDRFMQLNEQAFQPFS